MRIPIARPFVGDEEQRAVAEVLAGEVFTKGGRVESFERAFAERHSAAHGIATSSGTSALTTALIAHGIGPGAEVIVPSFSFFATASSVLLAGAKPVFADIDADTYCLSVESAAAAITESTRAILVVHLYGLPADLPVFERLCAANGLVLLEDAAQAHGASVAGRPVGSRSTAAFSFFATKNITTFEGGMVLTQDAEVASRARMLRNHGRDGGLEHRVVGGNFRMTELAAAIGLVQLARLEEITRRRNENARYLNDALRGVVTPRVPPDREHVFHQYTVRVPRNRDHVLDALNERGIEARAYYRRPIHREPALAQQGVRIAGDLRETERASREVLSLPVHPGVGEAELSYIVNNLNALA
jgi:dTDP-4-amino-4,6-dideoxygalactose transaminase